MIAVCVKWIRSSAVPALSAADEAAIEMALRHAAMHPGGVIAVTAGGPDAEAGLRGAIAAGAATAIRVDAPADLDSAAVAAALAPVVAHAEAVWCGDYSTDRGTGSVPAFLAARLRRQQVLGVVAVDFGPPLRVTRRLDGGRREIVVVTGPAVLSVEGSIARLRRASLPAALAAQKAEVLPYGTTIAPSGDTSAVVVSAYRPRARVLPAPVGATALERLRVLTDVGGAAHAGETLEADPVTAARRILEVLHEWGYSGEGDHGA